MSRRPNNGFLSKSVGDGQAPITLPDLVSARVRLAPTRQRLPNRYASVRPTWAVAALRHMAPKLRSLPWSQLVRPSMAGVPRVRRPADPKCPFLVGCASSVISFSAQWRRRDIVRSSRTRPSRHLAERSASPVARCARSAIQRPSNYARAVTRPGSVVGPLDCRLASLPQRGVDCSRPCSQLNPFQPPNRPTALPISYKRLRSCRGR